MNKFEKLREFRQNKKLSYQEMSDLLSISKTYYWQIENGKRRLSYGMALEIAKIFRTKPDKIFYNDFAVSEHN